MRLCRMARFCALLRAFTLFCEFLCVLISSQNSLQKSSNLRRIVQKCTKNAFMQYPLELRSEFFDLWCHGRPRRRSWTSAPKSVFSCGSGDGDKLFEAWSSGCKGQEHRREVWTGKFMFMSFLSSMKGATKGWTSSLGAR